VKHQKLSLNSRFNPRCLSLILLTWGLVPISAIITLPVQAQQTPTEFAQAQTQNYTVLYVNAQARNDDGNGSATAPFRSITKALQQAAPNTIVKLAPGTYGQANGEVFPIELKPGVTVQGEVSDRGQSILIQGSGLFLSKTSARQQVTLIGANRAGLQGVTVSNPNPQGYGLWVESSNPVVSDCTFTANGHDGVSIVGNSAPILSNNYFYNNGANGITIYGTSRAELKENIFEKTGFGINIAQNAAPRLIGNRITQNKDGIVVQGSAMPMLRSNVIDGNDRDGLVAIGEARPDLGTTADQGNNTFVNNGHLDVNATASRQVIAAAGNQLTKTNGRLDLNASQISQVAVSAPAPAVSSRRPSREILAAATSVPTFAIAVPPANPTVQATVPSPVQSLPPDTTTVPTVGVPQELTFSRPEATSVASRLPSVTAIPVPASNPASTPASKVNFAAMTPAPAIVPVQSESMPMIASVPIAVQPGSGGGRSLPMPKQATIKAPKTPIPATMTFNNLVFPSNGSPARVTTPPAANPLLPVPGSSIPVGNIGEMSSVPVWRKSGRQPTAATPTTTSPVAATLRYRVVVDMADGEALRSVVPGAFTAVSGGRQVLQAGAFSDAGKANQLLQRLTSQGIRASLEQF
jgi:parallel beta-helix repeat protein